MPKLYLLKICNNYVLMYGNKNVLKIDLRKTIK